MFQINLNFSIFRFFLVFFRSVWIFCFVLFKFQFFHFVLIFVLLKIVFFTFFKFQFQLVLTWSDPLGFHFDFLQISWNYSFILISNLLSCQIAFFCYFVKITLFSVRNKTDRMGYWSIHVISGNDPTNR